MRCQGIPISFHQQICFQFPLLFLGDGLTFLYLCQVVANKMELLSLSGVVCRLCFVERPLLVSIIVNPLTKMVPNIKAPEGIRWTLSPKYPGQLGCRDKSLVCLSRALWEQAHGRPPAHPHL